MFIIKRIRHILVIGAVVLIAVFFRWNGQVSLFEQAVGWTNGALMKAGCGFAVPTAAPEAARRRAAELENENALLLKRIADERERVRKLEFELGLEPRGNATDTVKISGIVARVVRRDLERWHRQVSVDRGRKDGVRKGYIAMTGDGLVGRVVDVSAIGSTVLLITGNGTATSAAVRRRKVPAGESRDPVYCIAYGEGTGQIEIRSVPTHLKLRRGDVMATSGYGGNYPAGLPIGRVSKVLPREDRMSPLVRIRPAADIKNLYYVVLVAP